MDDLDAGDFVAVTSPAAHADRESITRRRGIAATYEPSGQALYDVVQAAALGLLLFRYRAGFFLVLECKDFRAARFILFASTCAWTPHRCRDFRNDYDQLLEFPSVVVFEPRDAA